MVIMKRKIVFATNNSHKLHELRAIAGDFLDILSLNDIGCCEDIPETAGTIEGNALMKARYVSSKYNVECFADDTGLEVKALGGEPGVRTARYASETGHDSMANTCLLLSNMKGVADRKARFVTVIALVLKREEMTFRGVCEGSIATEPSGSGGFGYDPVFIPENSDVTFAMMSETDKNKVSHRGKATALLLDFLKQLSD